MTEQKIDLEWLNRLEPNPEAEGFIRQEVGTGCVADLAEKFPNEDERAISASFLEKLILSERVTRLGVWIEEAIVLGELNLEGANIERPLFLQTCIFLGDVKFQVAHVHRVLSFNGSTFKKGINLNSIKVKGDLFLNEVKFHGPADFPHAQIGDQFTANKAQFLNDKVRANFHGLKAKGVFIKGAIFHGQVDFGWADITMNLEAGPLETERTESKARCKFKKSANFRTIKVGGGVFIKEAQFLGSADFAHASIGSNFEANGAQFLSEEDKANFNSLKVGKDVFFREGVEFRGPVDFTRMEVQGTASFDNATFRMTVTFTGARIGHQLGANSTSFLHEQSEINFQGIRVEDGFFINGTTLKGPLNISDSTIGTLVIENLIVEEGSSMTPLMLERSVVFNLLRIRGVRFGLFAARDLKARTLEFLDVAFTEPGGPDLEGMTYERIEVEKEGTEGLEPYLTLLRQANYSRQPYQQMAEFFRKKGEIGSWRKILMDMHWREGSEKKGWLGWLWNRFKFITIGYGHRPWLVLAWALGFILVGYLFAFTPNTLEAVESSKAVEFNKLNRLLYSLSLLLPVVRLPIEEAWKIKPTAGFAWTWAHIQPILGWVLAAFGIAGLTPWVK